jgi:SCO1/SenC
MTTPEHNVTDTPKKNNTALWMMILLFGLPYLAAYYFYFNRDDMSLGEQTNYGSIINPVRQLADNELTQIDGSKIKLSSLQGKWIMFSVGSSDCKASCQDNLYKIRQIKTALAAEHKRVKKAFFLTDVKAIDSFNELLKDYRNMHVIIPSGSNYKDYLSPLSVDGKAIEDGIFIIDPLGNYMMSFPKDAEAKEILKDMERLLKVSKIG